jgi:hypothetical protein
MDQQKVPTASPGRNEQGSTLSIRIPPKMWEFLDRERRQFSYPGAETLSISDVARCLLEAAARNRLEDLVEIRDLLEQPTEALLRMRRMWEDDQEFSRAEWDVLARYVEKGCEQHGFSSDSELPGILRASARSVPRVVSLGSSANPQLDKFYRGNFEHRQSERHTLPAVVQSIIADLRGSPGATRPLYATRNLKVALDHEQLEGGANVHRALRPFPPCLYRLAARGHWLAEQSPIRRERRPREWPEQRSTPVPDVTADNFVLSSILSDEDDLYIYLNLIPHGISLSLGPYPHIREFTQMIAHLAPGRYWRGRFQGRRRSRRRANKGCNRVSV